MARQYCGADLRARSHPLRTVQLGPGIEDGADDRDPRASPWRSLDKRLYLHPGPGWVSRDRRGGVGCPALPKPPSP